MSERRTAIYNGFVKASAALALLIPAHSLSAQGGGRASNATGETGAAAPLVASHRGGTAPGHIHGDDTAGFDRSGRKTPEIFVEVGHAAPINSLAITDDGSRLVTGSYDGTAILWDVVSRKVLRVFEHASPVWYVAISSDGRRLATGTAQKEAVVW